MNNLVFACVVPHSALLIPLLSGPESARALQSRAAMEKVGGLMEAARPETIVILETHSMLVDGAISLFDSAGVHGDLGVMSPPRRSSCRGTALPSPSTWTGSSMRASLPQRRPRVYRSRGFATTAIPHRSRSRGAA